MVVLYTKIEVQRQSAVYRGTDVVAFEDGLPFYESIQNIRIITFLLYSEKLGTVD
jgi:hypothetical protein